MNRSVDYDEQKILDLYEEYESARPVAEVIGVSSETVYRVLRKHCVKRTHRHVKQPSERDRPSGCNTKYCPTAVYIAINLLDKDTRETADMLDMPIQSVNSILTRRYPDIKQSLKRCCNMSDVDMDDIEAEYIGGASTYELGRKYGVCHQTISKWMAKRGHVRGKNSWNDAHKKADHSRDYGGSRHHRRARMYGVYYEHGITLEKLIERDGNVCKICGEVCDKNDKTWGHCGPMYPSIDHIVAMSNGGPHTWENVQLAHIICNSRKRDLAEVSA